MILNSYFRKGWIHASAKSEALDLVSKLMAELKCERASGISYSPGEDAWLQFSREPLFDMEDLFRPGRQLRISFNRNSGYGAMVWASEIDDNVLWVSDNPEPPSFDPRVVLDPGTPVFHDPASALPGLDFRKALEEFCLSDSGERPASASWIRGDLGGRRIDRK